MGQPNLDGNPLSDTVARQCSSIFPELLADNAFAFPPPAVCSVVKKATVTLSPSESAPKPPAPPITTDSYTQTIGGAVTADLQIPVPLISSKCHTKPAFLLRRSGPVTTSVHRIPYNSPCSRSRKLFKVTVFPTCPPAYASKPSLLNDRHIPVIGIPCRTRLAAPLFIFVFTATENVPYKRLI